MNTIEAILEGFSYYFEYQKDTHTIFYRSNMSEMDALNIRKLVILLEKLDDNNIEYSVKDNEIVLTQPFGS